MYAQAFGPFIGNDTLSEYISRYRRADLPPVAIGDPLDLYPDRPAPNGFDRKLTWASPWPFADHPGVYLLYSEGFEILYIGKASMSRNLGKRLWERFGAGKTCRPKEEWLKPIRFVINIAVPKELAFEAPAIEEFLILKLRPKFNGTGK